MANHSFYEFLEYELCKAFKLSDNKEISSYWCDGIILSEEEYHTLEKLINNNKEIRLKAFIGKDGQSEYDLTVKFGKKSLVRYQKNGDIQDCFAFLEEKSLFAIDTEKSTIEITLP